MKRQLTPEEERKRDERKAKFKAIVQTIAKMTATEKEQLAKRWLPISVTTQREFSACNCILLAMQLPGATLCGGFGSWLKQGRAVRKGEHGASVWVPIGRKETATNGEETITADGERVGFIAGTVFDISQTDPIADLVDPYGRITGETTHVTELPCERFQPAQVSGNLVGELQLA